MQSSARDHLRLYRLGSIRGVRKAAEFSGLSKHEILDLTEQGVIAWYPHGDRGDRMISKLSLIEYLARQYGERSRRANT